MIFDPVNPKRINEIRKKLEQDSKATLNPSFYEKYLNGFPIRRLAVIELTKLNGTPFMLNAELIETMEATPDTVITLVTGRKYIVKEPIEEVRDKFIRIKQTFIHRTAPNETIE